MIDYIDTKGAAEYMGCSTRRVRALLSQGRMTGKKDGFTWLVKFPIQCTVGRSGPLIRLRKKGISLRGSAGTIEKTNKSVG